jgi:hypothetical protein
MNRFLIISIVAVFVLVIGVALSSGDDTDERSAAGSQAQSQEENLSEQIAFTGCLAEAGVTVYGTRTCPACTAFADQFGGYEGAEPIFVECQENPEECQANMQTQFVPEVQFGGELLENPVSVEQLAELTECEATFL